MIIELREESQTRGVSAAVCEEDGHDLQPMNLQGAKVTILCSKCGATLDEVRGGKPLK